VHGAVCATTFVLTWIVFIWAAFWVGLDNEKPFEALKQNLDKVIATGSFRNRHRVTVTDDPFDDSSIRQLCSKATWNPERLVLNCNGRVGGVGKLYSMQTAEIITE